MIAAHTKRVVFSLGLLLAVAPLQAIASQAASAHDLATLQWMAGCWEMSGSSPRVTNESWMAPRGGLMLGMSRTVVRDTAREFEALRIERRRGVATYVAQPGGGAPTAFAATTFTDSLVVFANPAHDFPQRILYRRAGRDSIVARIEGDQGGTVRGFDFPMRRVNCVP
jgi:hypothetical protein